MIYLSNGTSNMITPDRPKAMQEYLLSLWLADRIWFLKVETGEWPAIVFNEWDRSNFDSWGNLWYDKWVDIFPILIDVVVKYEDYLTWYTIRNKIRQMIWKFNWKLTNDREWNISFREFLSPSYNHETNEIVFWGIYLLKQNYDYEETQTSQEEIEETNNEVVEYTEQVEEDFTNNEIEDVDNSD